MTPHIDSHDITETNRTFYNSFWSNFSLAQPDRFNTWPIISELLSSAPERLEVGPGLRPRLPIQGTHFIDISSPAIEELKLCGGNALVGEFKTLPYSSQQFDLVCAFDVIEHLHDDRHAFAELSRVLKDGGILIVSVPLHTHLWTVFDDWSGHARRYDPMDLLEILADNQLALQKSAAFGMQPTKPKPPTFGTWCLNYNRHDALLIFNRVMVLNMNFQKSLDIVTGLLDTSGVDELLFVCKREFRNRAQTFPTQENLHR